MAKIKLQEKPQSMLIFLIKLRRSYRDLHSQADPARALKLYIFHLKRTFHVSRKHRHEAFLRGLTLNFSRMLGNFITGSPGEMNYSERFQIVFKKL